jgi:predicted  nucleic acid-binding Zn-ribbon protein
MDETQLKALGDDLDATRKAAEQLQAQADEVKKQADQLQNQADAAAAQVPAKATAYIAGLSKFYGVTVK